MQKEERECHLFLPLIWYFVYIKLRRCLAIRRNIFLTICQKKNLFLKGIFILLVFFSHFNSYSSFTNYSDLIYVKIVSLIGQAMVAMFMFYSGYGMMESIKNKGKSYISDMPRKRIFSTWLHFACIVAIYAILATVIGNEISFGQLMLSFISLDSVGNSNWYIFDILCLYLIICISFLIAVERYNWQLSAFLSLLLVGGLPACIF